MKPPAAQEKANARAGAQKPPALAGNADILKRQKTAYLASRKYPAKAVTPSFDWAEQARDNGDCIISGFHSPLEEGVRDILLAGGAPLIWVIARAAYAKPPRWTQKPLADGRLLIIAPAAEKRAAARAALARNRLILSLADSVVIGYAAPAGALAAALAASRAPARHLAAP